MKDGTHLAYSTAKGYVQSAMLIVSSPNRYQTSDDSSFILSFHNLIGFAVELYLKSFLLHTGISDDVLRSKKMGHKLGALLEAAVDRGFPEEVAREIVDYVGPQHETFEYRYMREGGSYDVKSLGWIFERLSDLDIAIDAAVGASALHNRQPGGRWSLTEHVSDWRLPKGAA